MACTLHVAWDDRLAGYDFGSAGWLRAFDAVVPPLLRAFRPQILDSQHGCDIHRLDPLANLRLSIDAHRGVPVIALAVAGGLDWARDICQRVQQTVTWRV